MDRMQQELDKWIDGDILTDITDSHGTRLVICKNGDNYSAFRAFPMGTGIGVSADKQSVTADKMICYLAASHLS